ncbi:MAG TPA: helix-turn-helix transcriptional regulator [Tepidisphaeraceae bacterium]|nr:helix-turn-helix transcriptional regulator [Tepidisphaeraceae bacterium]
MTSRLIRPVPQNVSSFSAVPVRTLRFMVVPPVCIRCSSPAPFRRRGNHTTRLDPSPLIVCRLIVSNRYGRGMVEKEPTLAAFGEAVRELRTSLGISQEALAEAAGIHRTYVGDVERGQRNLALLNISKLAEALQRKPSELMRIMERRLNRIGRRRP